jgi:lactose/L-arabinose transport system permease protein
MSIVANTARVTRSRKRILTQKNAPYFFLLPMLALYMVFKIYPYLYSAWLSVTTNQSGKQVFSGVSNYRRLLSDQLFWKALGNTAIILVVQVPLMLILAIILAVAFNSVLLKFRAVFRMGYFLPIVMGLVAYGILFKNMFDANNGVVNYLLDLINVNPIPWLTDSAWAKFSIILAMTWHYTGQNAIIYLAQLQSVPNELYEAASVDGANGWWKFRAVTIPGIRPAILLTTVLSTIGTLQLFDEPYVLTNGGPDNATLTVGMYLYMQGFKYFDFGYASAIGYVLLLIVVTLSCVQFWIQKER